MRKIAAATCTGVQSTSMLLVYSDNNVRAPIACSLLRAHTRARTHTQYVAANASNALSLGVAANASNALSLGVRYERQQRAIAQCSLQTSVAYCQ